MVGGREREGGMEEGGMEGGREGGGRGRKGEMEEGRREREGGRSLKEGDGAPLLAYAGTSVMVGR